MRIVLLITWFLFLLLPAATGQEQEQEQDRERAKTLAREVHLQGGYPDTLPLYEDPEPVKPEPSGGGGIDLSGLSPVILASLAALLLLVFFSGNPAVTLRERLRKKPAAPARAEAIIPADEGWETRDPEALTGAGHLAATLAALLYQALRLTGWEPVGRQASLTAREILARVAGGDRRRDSIAIVVVLAEQTKFGGREVTAAVVGQAQEAFSRAAAVEVGS